MTESLAGYKLGEPNEDKDSPPQDELLRVRDFLVAAACQSQEAIVREAQTRGCKPKDLHATLLLLIHTPWQGRDLVGAIQVGDGTIGVLTDDDVCTIMGVSDYGEFSSETRFLTTPDIESEFEQRVRFTVRTGVRCIAAMCDGVADDFFPEGKRLVELFLGNPIPGLKTKDGGALLGLLRQALKEPREGMAVREWLEYEKRGSSDDRTLVAMYRRDLV
jgi:hypothetical protein